MSEIVRSVSPTDPEDEVGSFPVADARDAAEAVARARAAYPGWRELGFAARATLLRRFRDLVAAADIPDQ